MNLAIRPYKAADSIGLGGDAKYARLREAISPFAYSIFFGDRCIGCAGIAHYYGEVYGCWAHFTPEIKAHALWFHRNAQKYWRAILATLPWQRIEALVVVNEPGHCRWIESLGFQHQHGWPLAEKKIGPNGEDCYRYAMVK